MTVQVERTSLSSGDTNYNFMPSHDITVAAPPAFTTVKL